MLQDVCGYFGIRLSIHPKPPYQLYSIDSHILLACYSLLALIFQVVTSWSRFEIFRGIYTGDFQNPELVLNGTSIGRISLISSDNIFLDIFPSD